MIRETIAGCLAALTCLTTMASAPRGELFDKGNYAMFIHWGLYSHLANKWDGKTYYGAGEWLLNDHMAGADIDEYCAKAAEFNPTDFDARKIARLAKDAGMKYVIITSKHHDGFAMYHSECNPFNIVDATPFGRDPMKELAEACREEGLGFGFYYSHNQDWTTPGGTRGPAVDKDGNPRSFDDYYQTKCLPQVEEITRNYGDMVLIWFDTPGGLERKYAEELVEVVHRNQPNALVSGRVGFDLGDYQTFGDMEIPTRNVAGRWESIEVTNDSWGYAWYDNNWKTPEQILRSLISTVARGGTFMLNIGPDGRGNVPDFAAHSLRQSGRWIADHPYAVYDADPSPWGHAMPWGDVVRKGNKLYLAVFDWPTTGKLYLPGLKSEVKGASVARGAKMEKTQVSKEDSWTVVDVPTVCPDPYVGIVELELAEGDPEVDNTLALDPDTGYANLSVLFADAEGCEVKKSSWLEKFGEFKHVYCVGNLHEGGSVTWTFDVKEPGIYNVDITTRGNAPQVFRVVSDEGKLLQNRQRSVDLYMARPLGWLELEKPGRHTLTLTFPDGGEPVAVSSISLTPIR